MEIRTVADLRAAIADLPDHAVIHVDLNDNDPNYGIMAMIMIEDREIAFAEVESDMLQHDAYL